MVTEWLRRQRAQQLVNWGAVAWVEGAAIGERIETSEATLPFHRVTDVFVAGRPALICRRDSLPYEIFLESLPLDRRGLTKRFLRDGLNEDRTVRLEQALCLSDWWFENYWHWLFEKLPKVFLAEETGFTGTYIVPPHGYCAESLRLAGIAAERIVVHTDQTFRVAELYLSPRLIGTELLRHQALLATQRDRLLAAVQPAGSGRRFYLSRNQGKLNGRRVVNESALRDLALRHGFEAYVGEGKTLAEQIADFAGCAAVLGPHGAAFANCLFMPPGGLVVEAFAPVYVFHHIHPAVRLLGLRHYQMLPETDLRQPTLKSARKRLKRILHPPAGYPHGDNVMVDLDVVETALLRELR